MFKKLQILNFRGIKNLEMNNISNFNLIVGSNNSGKSTILESLFLLTGFSNSSLPLKLNSFRGLDIIGVIGWKSFFRNLDSNNLIKINANLKDKSKRELSIKPHMISTENISANAPTLSSTTSLEINGLEFSGKISNGKINKFKSVTYLDTENPQKKITNKFPLNYNEIKKGVWISTKTINNDLKRKFDQIQISKRKSTLIPIFQKIEPRLKDIFLGEDGIYIDLNLDSLVPLQLMGDGLIKILAIILAIIDVENGIIFIDEIENGLYYKSQSILWEAIIKTAEEYNVQVFATTHSMENIKAFSNVLNSKKSGSLYRIENENNSHNLSYFSQEEIKDFIENNWEMR